MNRVDVYAAIDGERKYQDEIHRNSPLPDSVTPVAAWLIYIEQKLFMAKRHVYQLNERDALDEVRKIAALAVACMEYRGAPRREGF